MSLIWFYIDICNDEHFPFQPRKYVEALSCEISIFNQRATLFSRLNFRKDICTFLNTCHDRKKRSAWNEMKLLLTNIQSDFKWFNWKCVSKYQSIWSNIHECRGKVLIVRLLAFNISVCTMCHSLNANIRAMSLINLRNSSVPLKKCIIWKGKKKF